MKKPKKTEAVISLVLLFLTLMWGMFPRILFSPDKWLSDFICQQPTSAEKKIYIIAIDDKTLKKYGALTSWSREVPAELIERLSCGKTRPAVIGLDVIYSENGAGDARFAEACKEAGNVVTAMSFRFKEMPAANENGNIIYDSFYVDDALMPYDALAESAEEGFANSFLDADGYVRRAAFAVEYNGKTIYSLAGEVYRRYQESRGNEAAPPKVDENGLFYFSYSGKSGCYSTVSMADVLDGTVDPRLFTDAIVFVGACAEGLQDAYRPSVSRNQQMYGVEIQANITEALLEGRTQVDFPQFPYAAGLSVVAVLYFFLMRRQKITWATAVWALFCVADIIFVRVMYGFGFVTPALLPILLFSLIYAGNLVYGYVTEIMRRKRIVHMFKKYVAPEVVEHISKKKDAGIVLGGENRNIAVLFVDIRGFTSLSESMRPEEVVEILNQYLSLTTEAILKNGGMLDKFVGDAAMGVFNAPLDLDDYIFRAVCAAWDMQAGADAIAEMCRSRFRKNIGFGIGVHCGEAVVGNIGCEFRMDYTAIGDTVNTASRLEGSARSGQILISADVYEAVKDRVEASPVGELLLKGKENGVAAYELDEVRRQP